LLVGLLLLIGGYLQSTIQSEFKVNPLPSWTWTLIIIALIAFILYRGVRLSTRSQLVLALISIIVVTIFLITVIVKLGSANSAKPFEPSSSADGWSGIFFGVLYGVLLFVGFETAANLAEETPKPRREIPIAVMTTAGIATIVYVIATYVEVAGFHYSLKSITAAAGAPLFALGASAGAGGYGGTWIDRLLELVVLFDMIAVAIGRAVSASRGLFAMARDPAHPGAPRDHVQEARLAARRVRLHHRRGGRDAAGEPVLDEPVRAAGDAALLRAVRLGLDLRRVRARRRVPADVGRLATQLRRIEPPGAGDDLGRGRHPDHRRCHLRRVLQGDQCHHRGAVVCGRAAMCRLRVHLHAPSEGTGRDAARGPDRRPLIQARYPRGSLGRPPPAGGRRRSRMRGQR
jgi:Amino acid permease